MSINCSRDFVHDKSLIKVWELSKVWDSTYVALSLNLYDLICFHCVMNLVILFAFTWYNPYNDAYMWTLRIIHWWFDSLNWFPRCISIHYFLPRSGRKSSPNGSCRVIPSPGQFKGKFHYFVLPFIIDTWVGREAWLLSLDITNLIWKSWWWALSSCVNEILMAMDFGFHKLMRLFL